MDIKVVIFDLDDTLLDTTGLLIPIAKTPAFYERIKRPLPLLDGALKNLEYCQQKYQLGFVTMGHVESQRQKVDSLGVGNFFAKMYFADPQKQENKLKYFEQAKKDFAIVGREMLSIGNRRSMDIREAKIAGAWTCLFKYGEHLNEKVVVPEDNPDFEVSTHQELIKICRL